MEEKNVAWWTVEIQHYTQDIEGARQKTWLRAALLSHLRLFADRLGVSKKNIPLAVDFFFDWGGEK